MGILQIIKNLLARSPTAAAAEKTQMQFVQQYANNLYVYDGKIYRSDIVRSCIRPKIKAVGKGTCYVYAYTQNGVYAKVKVTVK